MIKKKIVAAVTAVVLGMSAMSACAFSSDDVSDPAFTTLRYEGGDTGGSKFKDVVEPGEKLVSNDKFYSYPNTQREAIWDSSGFIDKNNDGVSEGTADYPDLEVTDKDGRSAFVKMKISFNLNTDTTKVEADGRTYPGGTIQAFHELIGKTRKAYFDTSEDGNGSYGYGWIWAMTNYIGVPTQDFVSKAVRPQQVETLYTDNDKQEEIEKNLADSLPTLVNDVMETDLQFYDNFTVNIYKIQPDAEYLTLIREREDAQIKSETAQKNAEAKVAEANANAQIAAAEAKIKRAEIDGYGGFDNYKCIYLADHGLNCAQPQYVVGGSK